jgi:hypothetical protein
VSAATHLYRRKAMYYWRRRLPNALASWFHKRHLFLSFQTPDPNFARRLVVLLDAKLEEVVAAFEQADMHLTPSQVDGLLRDVVTGFIRIGTKTKCMWLVRRVLSGITSAFRPKRGWRNGSAKDTDCACPIRSPVFLHRVWSNRPPPEKRASRKRRAAKHCKRGAKRTHEWYLPRMGFNAGRV